MESLVDKLGDGIYSRRRQCFMASSAEVACVVVLISRSEPWQPHDHQGGGGPLEHLRDGNKLGPERARD